MSARHRSPFDKLVGPQDLVQLIPALRSFYLNKDGEFDKTLSLLSPSAFMSALNPPVPLHADRQQFRKSQRFVAATSGKQEAIKDLNEFPQALITLMQALASEFTSAVSFTSVLRDNVDFEPRFTPMKTCREALCFVDSLTGAVCFVCCCLKLDCLGLGTWCYDPTEL